MMFDLVQELAGFGDLKLLAKRLTTYGPETVVITKGAKGVIAYHQGQ